MRVMDDMLEEKDTVREKAIKEKDMIPRVGDTVYVREECVQKYREFGPFTIFDDVIGKQLKIIKMQLIWDPKMEKQAVLVTMLHPSKSGFTINTYMTPNGKSVHFPNINMFEEGLFN